MGATPGVAAYGWLLLHHAARRSDVQPPMFTGELCFPTHFSLAEILVLPGTAGAGGMATPTNTRTSARLKRVQGHSSPVNVPTSTHRLKTSF